MNKVITLKQQLGNFLHVKLNKFKEIFENDEEKSILYKGFTLFYSNHTSIVKRFIKEGDYEPEVQQQIIRILQKSKSPVFIDVGANIGMISLGILSKLPACSIYAFEPGPHQLELFQRTIQFNKLESKISLYNVALSNKNSYNDFVIHEKKHAVIDGFIETERGGKVAGTIKVKVKTLDTWWRENKQVKIDFIKIDTEGAEFWVLQGGKECILQCEPALVVEINPKNLKNYPHSEFDTIDLIYSYGYSCSINGQLLNKETLVKNFLATTEEFVFIKNNEMASQGLK